MHFTELQAAARGQDPACALINYYGVSYGTQIGHTLVATYPDRLNRVLLDANTNSVASYTGWEPTTIDGYDEVVGQFCKLCAEAGEMWCALATGNTSTAADVQAKFDQALEMLRTNPVEFNGTTYDDYKFLDYLAPAMYFPRSTDNKKGYRRIANATASVLKQDAANAFLYVEKDEVDDGSPKATGYELQIITAADVADRFPFKTYEEWKVAGEKLASTARYGAKGYVLEFGYVSPFLSLFSSSFFFLLLNMILRFFFKADFFCLQSRQPRHVHYPPSLAILPRLQSHRHHHPQPCAVRQQQGRSRDASYWCARNVQALRRLGRRNCGWSGSQLL